MSSQKVGAGYCPQSHSFSRQDLCLGLPVRGGRGYRARGPPLRREGASHEALPSWWHAWGVRWPRFSELGAGCGPGRGHQGLLRAVLAGDCTEVSSEAAGHSALVMAWMLDCLFASAFEPRPRRGEWGPPCHRAGVLSWGLPGAAAWLGALGLGSPPPLASFPAGF